MKVNLNFAVKNIDKGLGGKYTCDEDLDNFTIQANISHKELDKLEEWMNKEYRHLQPRLNYQIIEFRGHY